MNLTSLPGKTISLGFQLGAISLVSGALWATFSNDPGARTLCISSMIFIGSGLLIGSIASFIIGCEQPDKCIKTDGIITQVQASTVPGGTPHGHINSTIYTPTVKFTSQRGAQHEVTMGKSHVSNKSLYNPNEHCTVLYNEHNPEDAYIYRRRSLFSTIFGIIFGAIFAIVGFLCIVRH